MYSRLWCIFARRMQRTTAVLQRTAAVLQRTAALVQLTTALLQRPTTFPSSAAFGRPSVCADRCGVRRSRAGPSCMTPLCMAREPMPCHADSCGCLSPAASHTPAASASSSKATQERTSTYNDAACTWHPTYSVFLTSTNTSDHRRIGLFAKCNSAASVWPTGRGVCPLPAQMWQGRAPSRRSCGGGEPSQSRRGCGMGVSPVRAQMCRRCS